MQRFWKKSYFEAMEIVKTACETVSISLADASLAWLQHHSQLGFLPESTGHDSIIIGQSSMKHLEANLEGCSGGPLPSEIVAAFDKAWRHCKGDCPPYSQ